ncbi:hypothetical protein B4U80_10577, partial [Leptotrombidium deliense]
MSFLGYKSRVECGDIATIYLASNKVYVQRIEKGKVFQTIYGALRHEDLIGKQYGTKVHCKKGWVYLLHITPELWTQNLPHRTQILYTTDISLITTMLYLKPGSVVVEAGTGSGSLSHSILRTISPNGHLYTFDFHEERVQKALKEFIDHGLDKLVSIKARDVCKQGFDLCSVADAVFLDLPNPWEAIPFAVTAMKSKDYYREDSFNSRLFVLFIRHLLRVKVNTVIASLAGSRICCFSPCIEQVHKTCVTLREHHFEDIDTIECVLKPFEMRRLPLTQFDCDKLPVNETDVSTASKFVFNEIF